MARRDTALADRAAVTREWVVRFENGKVSVALKRVFDVLTLLDLVVELGDVPLCGLSSSKLVLGFVECAVAEHGVEDVAASAGEGDEGLVMAFALGDLAVVVGA